MYKAPGEICGKKLVENLVSLVSVKADFCKNQKSHWASSKKGIHWWEHGKKLYKPSAENNGKISLLELKKNV